MIAINTKEDLVSVRKRGLVSLYPDRVRIRVGTATCGNASGARDVLAAVRAKVEALKANIEIATTGCIGFCQHEPILDVWQPGMPLMVYCDVTPKIAEQIVEALHIGQVYRKNILGKISSEHLLILDETKRFSNGKGDSVADVPELDTLPFYQKQLKIVLRNCGYMDPLSFEECVARGGYWTAHRIFTERPDPWEMIQQVIESGLRGRGGAGFHTGVKWEYCRKSKETPRFLICNADEGDPGAYMDRSVLEGDPHAVIEGMMIGAYAVGCHQGYIYVRNEYPEAVKRLTKALEDARAHGILGDHLFGTKFRFDIELTRGAGAFVCGEETALLESVVGLPGMPRPRPPYPAERGLFEKPTIINNVETWANVPIVFSRGSKWFSSIGVPTSTGTKVFSLVGKVKNVGLIEVPMGITLKEILYEIGGGPVGEKPLKAVQTGGPSGGCLLALYTVHEGEDVRAEYNGGDRPDAGRATHADLPVDFDTLTRAGSMMGSGGMVVMDRDSCMVDVARFFLDFLSEESCGKCVPCREGIRNMRGILNRICEGEGREEDLAVLEQVGRTMIDTSLCALGATAPNPVLSTLKYFHEEYEAHIHERRCPAGFCKKLIKYSIDPQKCTGCHLCFSPCPTECIVGKPKQKHVLDETRCIKCGACYEVCKDGAVVRM